MSTQDYDDLTEAQRNALNRAHDILHEHFDAGIIRVAVSEDKDDEDSEITAGSWFGGPSACIGLCVELQHELLRRHHEGTQDQ